MQLFLLVVVMALLLLSTRAFIGHARIESVDARRPAQRVRQDNDQQLAWRVQDILVGCGLSQVGYSIGGSRVFRIPQVVSVVAGPPVGVDVRILPGQTPDDFTTHAKAIAYNLDVAEVQVVPLGPYFIRLELLPKSDPARASGTGSQTLPPRYP
jgi:hypothetical protein